LIADGVSFVRAARRVRAHIDQPHRYAHILRVARTASALARAHGADVLRARVAGLLHDLARLYSGERLLAECTERGMPIDAFERANPIVLHAPLGAELARDWFGIDDEAILSAIRKHTLATATMSTLDEIVYLADGLEPGREFAGRDAILALAFTDLHAAMRAQLAETLVYQERRGLTVAPEFRAAIAHYAHPPHREKRSA
jgi:predicted HD superfamily hydrolase involved in NAD metabolism